MKDLLNLNKSKDLLVANLPDLSFASAIIFVLVMLIIPVPTWLLDFSLAISITGSVLILMSVIFTEKSSDLSIFPTILLVITIFRLALNVATTRLILTHGHNGAHSAGEVICAFGSFMMGSNFVIGIIVFSILIIVNFVVITKGSGRIAEVAARFALDAMPGKQMSIDSDLSSGLINEEEAKKKRKKLEEEANFYGAMDGSAKFVRGDAIAAVIITIINIFAGILIGMFQENLSFKQAAKCYTILTVGDGLVSQLPALMISVAAGLLIAKANTEGSTRKVLISQLGSYPIAASMSAVLLLGLAVVPGIPKITFLLLAGLLAMFAIYGKQEEIKTSDSESANTNEEYDIYDPIEPIKLELGTSLLWMVNNNNSIIDQIKNLRVSISKDMGFTVPQIRINDNNLINKNKYLIKIKEVTVASGEIEYGDLLAIGPEISQSVIPGKNVKEPIFGVDAKWISPKHRQDAIANGYTVVDSQSIIATHLKEIINRNLVDIMSYNETQIILDGLNFNHKKLLAEIVPSQITVSSIQKILQGLLSERVSIRDINTVLEAIADIVSQTKNTRIIIEYIRTKLCRQICNSLLDNDGFLNTISLIGENEVAIAKSITYVNEEPIINMPQNEIKIIIDKIHTLFNKHYHLSPVILTSAKIRYGIKLLLMNENIPVLSQNEIHYNTKINILDKI